MRDFSYWCSSIGKGLRLQPAQKACLKGLPFSGMATDLKGASVRASDEAMELGQASGEGAKGPTREVMEGGTPGPPSRGGVWEAGATTELGILEPLLDLEEIDEKYFGLLLLDFFVNPFH